MLTFQTLHDRRFRTLAWIAGASCAVLLATTPDLVVCEQSTVAETLAAFRAMHGLNLAVLWLSGAIALAVISILLYSIIAYMPASGTERRHRPLREFIWALIPVAVIIGCAWPAVGPVASPTAAEQLEALPYMDAMCRMKLF